MREINDLAEGYEYAQDLEMQKLAWHAANIMNASGHLKRKVTPKKLLGKEKQPMTKEQRIAEWAKFEKLAERGAVKSGTDWRDISKNNS